MICIKCSSIRTAVTNSRKLKQFTVWRRRHCINCDTTFTTYESPSLADILVVRSPPKIPLQQNQIDRQDTTFNSGRLLLSVAAAFTHTPETIKLDALHLIRTIETELLVSMKSGQLLSTDLIVNTAYGVLKRYDELAGLQYAAQHKRITNLRRRGRPSFGA